MPYWLDGNNLIGQTAAQARGDRNTRRAFLRQLGEYASARGGRFTVFFDGDDPNCSAPPRGVVVRFSAPRSADDAILRALEGTRNPAEAIVVTNDAGLRGQCRAAGAKTMDWGEFTSIMNKPSRVPRGSAKGDDQVEVEDWARYFGLEDDSLE